MPPVLIGTPFSVDARPTLGRASNPLLAFLEHNHRRADVLAGLRSGHWRTRDTLAARSEIVAYHTHFTKRRRQQREERQAEEWPFVNRLSAGPGAYRELADECALIDEVLRARAAAGGVSRQVDKSWSRRS